MKGKGEGGGGGVVTKTICGDDEPQRFHPVTPLAAGRREGSGRALKARETQPFLYASESAGPHLEFFSVTKFKQ